MQVAAILAKANGTSKKDIDYLGKKVARLTIACIQNKVKIVDVISITGSSKDAINKIKEIGQSGIFQYIVIDNPKDIADSKAEYLETVEELRSWYGIQVQVIK